MNLNEIKNSKKSQSRIKNQVVKNIFIFCNFPPHRVQFIVKHAQYIYFFEYYSIFQVISNLKLRIFSFLPVPIEKSRQIRI